MRPVFEVRVGGRIWLDGQGWDVAELTGSNVRLTSGSSARLVSITSLAEATPASMDEDDTEDDAGAGSGSRWEVPALLLASLAARQHQQLRIRVQEAVDLGGQAVTAQLGPGRTDHTS